MKIKNILISQPRPTTERSPYFDMEERYGVHFEFHQLIRIEEVSPQEFRAQHINILEYTAIIFNSKLSVDHFFHLCELLRVAIPETMHYYCLSKAIADYLQKYIQYRKRKVFFSENNRFEDLLPAMGRRPDERFLMVMSDIHNDGILNMFAENGVKVTPAVMYRTVNNDLPAGTSHLYDMFILFTAAGVQALKQNCPDFDSKKQCVGCFGPATKQALIDSGFEVAFSAPTPQCPSITMAIDKFLQANTNNE